MAKAPGMGSPEHSEKLNTLDRLDDRYVNVGRGPAG